MLNNLIGEDIKLMRFRYDEALQLQGIPCKYQYPLMADTNAQGESVIDSYSDEMDIQIFFDGNPKVKTYKRYGWVVENEKELPFLIHCSFNLPNLQRDCIFRISGLYSEMLDRVFKVTELTCDMVAPDHMICQVIPVYNDARDAVVGKTDKEISKKFNRSNYFLKDNVDYRGNYRSEGTGEK